MADGADNIGNLEVSITGEFSELQKAIDSAAQAAEQGGAKIAEGFVEGGTELLKITGLVVGAEKAFEVLKDQVTEAFQAFSEVQTATTALTALTHNAQGAVETIENLKTLAISDALSFPQLVQATQRMTAFGIATEVIPSVLRAAADASAATGNAFDNVANSIERLSLSGVAGTRQLVQLGLSTQDLARVMGISAAEVKEAFKDLDVTERAQVITDALDKFSGTAQEVAKGIGQQWKNLQTEWTFVLEEVGKDLEPAGEAVIGFAHTAIDNAKVVGTAFADMSSSVKDSFDQLTANARTAYDSLVPKEVQEKLPGFAQLFIQQFTNPVTVGLMAMKQAAQDAADKILFLRTLEGFDDSAPDKLAAALERLRVAGKNADDALQKLGESQKVDNETLIKAEEAQTKANKAVTDARVALQEEKEKLDAGNGSKQVYNRLTVELADALEKANPKAKDFAESVAGITDKLNKAQQSFTSAVAVFEKLASTAPDTAAGIAAVAAAYELAEKKAKAAGQAFATAAGEAAKIAQADAQNAALYEANQKALQGFIDVLTDGNKSAEQHAQATRDIIALYPKLKTEAEGLGSTYHNITAEMLIATAEANKQHIGLDNSIEDFKALAGQGAKTIEDQTRIANAFKTVEGEASKYGLAVQRVGDNLTFTIKPGQEATKALQDLLVVENQAAIASGNFVLIGGKLVPTLEAIANAAHDADATVGKIVKTADGGTVIISGLGDAAKKTASHVADFGAAAQQAGTYVVPLNSAVNDGKAYFVNMSGAVDAHAKSLKGLGDAAQGAMAHIIPLNGAVNDGKAFYESAATAQQMLIRTHADLSDAAVAARKQMYDEDQELANQVHVTQEGTQAKKDFIVQERQLDGTMKDVKVSVQGADEEIAQYNADVVKGTTDAEEATTASDGLAGGYDAVAAAAYDAATAINSAAAAEQDWIAAANSEAPGGGFGGKNMSPSNAEGMLALMASMGADNAELDQAAQAFGLVPVGNRSYVTKDEFIKMTGGVLEVDGSGHLVAKPKAANTDQFGRPIASTAPTPGGPSSSSGGSSSGVVALDQAAGSAAHAVSGFGSATSGTIPVVQAYSSAVSSAATPLGAFVTGIANANSATIPVVQALTSAAKSASDFYTAQEKATGVVSASAGNWDKATADFVNAQNALSDAVANEASGAKLTSDQFYALQQAIQQTGSALHDLQGQSVSLGDASDDTAKIFANTNTQASDFYTALQKSTGAVDASTQKYDQALSASVNAQNAYTNALISGKGVSDEVYAAWLKTAQVLNGLTGQGGVATNDAFSSAAPASLVPTKPPPSAAPSGSEFGATGGWEWNGTDWVWNASGGRGAMSQTRLGSKQFDPMQNIDAFDPARGTGGMGGLISNTNNGGMTLNLTVQAGTVVGTGGMDQLTNMMMSKAAQLLKQAGQKV